MKSIVISVRCGLLLVVAAAFASCSKEKYAAALPKDATVVGCINPTSIVKKGGLAEFANNAKIKRQIDKMGKDLNGESKKMFDKLFEDPSASGIDFSQKIFFFFKPYHDDMSAGLVMKIKNQDELTQMLKAFAIETGTGEPTQKDGYRKLEGTGRGALVYTAETLLVLWGDEDMNDYAAQLIKQSEEESFISDKSFDKLASSNSDISTLTRPDLSSELLASVGKAPMQLPAGCEAKDLRVLSSTQFETGRVSTRFEALAYSDAWKAQIKKINSAFDKIGSKFLNKTPSDAFMLLAANVDADKWKELGIDNKEMTETPTKIKTKDPESMFTIFEKYIDEMDGNVVLCSRPNGFQDIEMAGFVEPENDALIDKFKETIPGTTIGKQDGYTFFSTSNTASDFGKRLSPSFEDNKLAAKDIRSARVAVYANLSILSQQLPYQNGFDIMARVLSNMFDYAIFSYQGNNECKFDIVMKNQEENALHYLIAQAVSMAKMI